MLPNAITLALDRLRLERFAHLPRFDGASHVDVARALHVAFCERVGFQPLWIVDEPDVGAALEITDGALLVVASPGESTLARLRRAAADGAARVLVGDSSLPVAGTLRVPESHRVAADPSLARVRAALLAHGRSADVVHLAGPIGSGRRSLAGWLAEQIPGTSVVADVEECSRAELGALLERLVPPDEPVRPTGRPTRPHGFDALIGSAPALLAALDLASRAAPRSAPVLVLGESGTGKEPLSRAIAANSGRIGAFVAIDLSSRGEELVDDDLFGHERGAFNGADRPRDGAFRTAHKGTLFLDEVGNLSLRLQKKLLRVLETGEVQPLGSDRVHRVDVRVIAATNADLEAMVRSGEFRADLLHRLSALTVRLPPLRARRADVAVLVAAVLARLDHREAPSDEVQRALAAWDWPGNVRELIRVCEEIAADGDASAVVARRLVRGPMVITSSGDLGASALRAGERVRATEITLQVPSLAQRGRSAVLHAVACACEARVPTPEALDALLRTPWWSGRQLARCIRSLDRGRGPIRIEELRAVLPELGDGPTEPICFAIAASIRADGTLAGLSSAHPEQGVVIGRARGRADLGSESRREWLDARVDGPVGFVELPQAPDVSRAHVLVGRDPAGLWLAAFPDAGLPVTAHPVGRPALDIGTVPTRIGRAARLVIGSPPIGIELVVALGRDTLDEVGAELVREHPVAATRPGSASRRVWQLDEDEIAALNGLLVSWLEGDGDLATLLRQTGAAGELAGTRLGRWLDSPHPSQYCGRLYAHASNHALVADLRARLGDRVDDRLPRPIREALQSGRQVIGMSRG